MASNGKADQPNSTHLEVIRALKDQGLHVIPVVKKAATRKNWQNEIFTGEITGENFGVRMGESYTVCIDVDDISLLPYFEYLKDKTYMVKSGNGFHIYTKSRQVGATKHYTNPDGIKIDLLSKASYVIGEGSTHYNKQGEPTGRMYELLSKDRKINEIDFQPIQDFLENNGFIKSDRRTNHKMRQRFLNGDVPTKGTSNLFYFNAAQQCLTDGDTREEATEKIKLNYNEWVNSPTFSGRNWSNIETAINKVYDDPEKWTLKHGGHNKGADIDNWKNDFFADRKIFADKKNEIIFENKSGFLVDIESELHTELVGIYRSLERSEFKNILFQLVGEAEIVPEKDNDRIVFPNGTFRPSTRKIEDTDLDKLAFLGFEDYEYIENPQCPKFQDVIFSGVPKEQHSRIKAGLKAIFQPKLDSRISVMYGLSGSGKSTGLSILGLLLKQNTLMIRPSTFAADPFLQAKIKDKLLVVFLDMPKDFDSYMNLMKTFTGESNQTVRGFHKDAEENLKIIAKFWGATNNLFSIPDEEKDPMFNRRLSLITKDIPKDPYPEDNDYAEKIVKEEGSHIISWILNLTDEECKYEPKSIVQPLWESLSEPERKWIEDNYEESSVAEEISVHKLMKKFKEDTDSTTNTKYLENLLKNELGFPVRSGIVRRLKRKPIPETETGTNSKGIDEYQ